MTLDIDALLKATAQEVWDEEEPSDGHLDAVWLSLAVIVPAVTAEVRALHSSTDEPTSDHYHCRPSECDQAGEGSLKPVCDECDMPSPCPTVRLLDELDAVVRGERS